MTDEYLRATFKALFHHQKFNLPPTPPPPPPQITVLSLWVLQGVVAAERSRGGRLLEEPKTLPFRANTFSLQVSIQDVPQFLWSIKPFTTCQVTD